MGRIAPSDTNSQAGLLSVQHACNARCQLRDASRRCDGIFTVSAQRTRTVPPVLLQYEAGSSSSANRGSAV